MAAAHTDFARAFTPDMVFRDSKGREQVAEVVDAGELVLPTGRIVACDPDSLQVNGLDRCPPLTRAVQPGRYPVLLSRIRSVRPPSPYADVAAAMIRFSDAEPAAWEMALRPGQDLATLPDGYYFGYGVDGGTGCFCDARLVEALRPERDDFARLALQGRKTGVVTWDDMLAEKTPFFRQLTVAWGRGPARSGPFVEVCGDPQTGANLIAFPSGIGDGSYASYWGLDAAGNPCRLATCFGLLLESFEETLAIPVGTGEPVYRHLALAVRGITALHVDTELDGRDRQVLIVSVVGRGHFFEAPRLRVGGEVVPILRQGGTRRNGRYNYEYAVADPLPADAELFVTFTARTVAL